MSEESKEKRLWRLRVWWAEYFLAKLEERAGLALVISSDESFVHDGHHCKNSLLPTVARGNVLPDIDAPKRSGNRS